MIYYYNYSFNKVLLSHKNLTIYIIYKKLSDILVSFIEKQLVTKKKLAKIKLAKTRLSCNFNIIKHILENIKLNCYLDMIIYFDIVIYLKNIKLKKRDKR